MVSHAFSVDVVLIYDREVPVLDADAVPHRRDDGLRFQLFIDRRSHGLLELRLRLSGCKGAFFKKMHVEEQDAQDGCRQKGGDAARDEVLAVQVGILGMENEVGEHAEIARQKNDGKKQNPAYRKTLRLKE